MRQKESPTRIIILFQGAKRSKLMRSSEIHEEILIATITNNTTGTYMVIFHAPTLYIDYNPQKILLLYYHNMAHKEGTHPELAMALKRYGRYL